MLLEHVTYPVLKDNNSNYLTFSVLYFSNFKRVGVLSKNSFKTNYVSPSLIMNCLWSQYQARDKNAGVPPQIPGKMIDGA